MFMHRIERFDVSQIHDSNYMAVAAAAATLQRILVTSKTLSRPHYSFLRRFCTVFFLLLFVHSLFHSSLALRLVLLFYTVIYFLHSFACSSRHIANVTMPLAIRNTRLFTCNIVKCTSFISNAVFIFYCKSRERSSHKSAFFLPDFPE